MMKPFLKWAGGKRWLSHRLHDLNVIKFERYIEPFLGGGAIFFETLPNKSILSDSNRDLIDTYTAIKTDWSSILERLTKHHKEHSREHYYYVRDKYFTNEFDRAARFIYLNRTCWNGLYRENLSGRFNVPKGTKSTVVFSEDNFELISYYLQNSELICSDFELSINKADKDDFVFIDPPYTVKHNNNGFLKYNEKIFSWNDQIRLRDAIVDRAKLGVKFISTNAYHPSIIKLYEDFANIIPLERHSVLSGESRYRSPTQEVLIAINVNFDDILIRKKARIFTVDQISQEFPQ